MDTSDRKPDEIGVEDDLSATSEQDQDQDQDQNEEPLAFDLDDFLLDSNFGEPDMDALTVSTTKGGMNPVMVDSASTLNTNNGNNKLIEAFNLPAFWKEYPEEIILSGVSVSILGLFALYSTLFFKGYRNLNRCVKVDREKWKNYKIILNSSNLMNFDIEKNGGLAEYHKGGYKSKRDPSRLMDYNTPNADYNYNTETTTAYRFKDGEGDDQQPAGVLDWISNLKPELKNPFSNMSPSLAKSKLGLLIQTPRDVAGDGDRDRDIGKSSYIDYSLPPVIVSAYSKSGNYNSEKDGNLYTTTNPNTSLNCTPSNLLPTQSVKKHKQEDTGIKSPIEKYESNSPDADMLPHKHNEGSASAAFVNAFYKPFKKLTGRNATTAEIEEEENAASLIANEKKIDTAGSGENEVPLFTALETVKPYTSVTRTGFRDGVYVAEKFSPIKIVQQMISPLSSPRKSMQFSRAQMTSPSIDQLNDLIRERSMHLNNQAVLVNSALSVPSNIKRQNTLSLKTPKMKMRYEINELLSLEPIELIERFEDLKGIDMLSLDLFFPKDINTIINSSISSSILTNSVEFATREEANLMSIEKEITSLRKDIINENISSKVQQISILRFISISNNNLEQFGNSIIFLMSYGILIENLVETGLLARLIKKLPFILSRALLEIVICYCNLNWELNKELRGWKQNEHQEIDKTLEKSNYAKVSNMLNLKFGIKPYLQSDFKIFKLVLQMISLGIQDDFLNKELIYLTSFNESPHYLIHIFNSSIEELQIYNNLPLNYPEIDSNFNTMVLELVSYLKRQYQGDHIDCCVNKSNSIQNNNSGSNTELGKKGTTTNLSRNILTRKKLPGSLGHNNSIL